MKLNFRKWYEAGYDTALTKAGSFAKTGIFSVAFTGYIFWSKICDARLMHNLEKLK